jgi:GNAT superfamily N-acetyltransferase
MRYRNPRLSGTHGGHGMTYTERAVFPSDLDVVCSHRERMFREGGFPADVVTQMAKPFRQWLCVRLANGTYFGWIIEEHDKPVAGLGMLVLEWPAHPAHPAQDRRGYILNVYVEPDHRRAGLGRRLMTRAADEARRRDITFLTLHATEDGRRLYETLGWRSTPEMAISVV